MIDSNSAELVIGIIGAGAMGQGIVQVALQGGIKVILMDAREGGAEAGRDQVFARLDRLVEKQKLNLDDVAEMKPNITIATSYNDFKPCHAVIEAVFEDLQLKRKIFTDLEAIVSESCVLVSNTSSLLIASIASTCRHKTRIAGLHFFNPVPLMKLVEVVRGPDTTDEVISFLTGLGKRLGRTPVVVQDAPGFLVNHGGRGYTTEAMRILQDRIASPDQVDAIMRDCCGYRMGPLELSDLTGMDVNYPVTRIVYEGFDNDPRLRTTFAHRNLLEAGRLGRKTSQGNYAYDEHGKLIANHNPDYQTSASPATSVVLIEADDMLKQLAQQLKLNVLAADDGKSPLLAAPLGEDCAAIAARLGLDGKRLVAVDLYCNTDIRLTLMTPPGADQAAANAVAASIISNDRKVTLIKDSTGFVTQRIQAIIANLGCEMAQSGIAEPQQIDLALKLGLNYPCGPLELAERMGLETLYQLSKTLHELSGDDRYRPSPWLRRRAMLGLPVHTLD